jgi:signal transduction histidine kinase
MALDRMLRKLECVAGVPKGWDWIVFLAVCAVLMAGRSGALAEITPAHPVPVAATLTNALQVRQLASRREVSGCSVRLEGIVLWVSPTRDRLMLQDASGGTVVKSDLSRERLLTTGQRVRIEGNCLAGGGEITFGAVVDNDGSHSVTERSGEVFLSAGLHPIRVEWFNGSGPFALEVEWMVPEMAREHVHNDSLFRKEVDLATGTNRLVHGLDYRCYEGQWTRLPDFSRLTVLKSGTVTNFDIGVRTRDLEVGLVFSGYFEAPRTGLYTFWTKSDDGSKLYTGGDAIRLTVLGKEPLPAAQRVFPGQLVGEEQEGRWAEMEGTVTVVREQSRMPYLVLTSGTGLSYLKMLTQNPGSLGFLLKSRIRATGIYRSAFAVGGQTVPALLVPSLDQITLVEMAPAHWVEYPVLPIGALAETHFSESAGAVVHIRGTVCSNSPGRFVVIEDETGRIPVETIQPTLAAGDHVEVLGWMSREADKVVVRAGGCREVIQEALDALGGLPLLTTASQVMSLSRSEAQRGYPLKIQGVVTARVGADFFIQDSTRSIYVTWKEPAPASLPDIGDYWEIEGKSGVDFAPDVQAHRAFYLGSGILPEPIRPAWDELINGTLATKYVEIHGVVMAVERDTLVLLTRGGKVNIQCYDLEPKVLEGLENALIRVWGVISPDRDKNQMILPRLRLFNASVMVDEPAPAHPFETSLKRASDLLFFDARADALRRVRIAGQVLHEGHGEYYLMDGTNGLRFKPKAPLNLQVGDQVEVVGFPDIGGPSPVLHEALARRIGKANLPAAQRLSENGLLNGKLDATLVDVESRLVGLSVERSEQVLELQTGNRGYVARLENRNGRLSGILPGSRLELTGTYMGQGGDRASSRDIGSFELLLNSPADIRVLARPSWWTVRHALMIMGGMLFVLLFALVWITVLRQQVEERSLQLAAEIKDRERAEHQRELEEERARIAQDLHDDLGATLTEIRFLSAVKSCDSMVPPDTRSQLSEVSEKSRQMVSSLDEIVWAVNPANDSLPSLAAYLRHIAEEFFRATPVRCRLDVEALLPPVALNSEVRHNLYLSIREALNNIAKHAQATEAWLRIHWQKRTLHIVVEDNGCGFTGDASGAPGNGLRNMRRRLEKIGGHFECDSRPGSGTVCRIHLPFD